MEAPTPGGTGDNCADLYRSDSVRAGNRKGLLVVAEVLCTPVVVSGGGCVFATAVSRNCPLTSFAECA